MSAFSDPRLHPHWVPVDGTLSMKSGRPTTRHDYGKVNEIGFGDDDTGNPSENSDNQDGATAISTAVFSPVKNKKDETLALLQSQLQSLDQEEEELRKDAEITKLQKRIEQKKKSVADLRVSHINQLRNPKVKRCLSLSDSMAKHVTDIRETDIRSYPGITIGHLTSKIMKGSINLNYENIVIHVGTNDVNNFSSGEISSLYSNLITAVKTFTDSSVTIYLSSILPRPVDFSETGPKVKEINLSLEAICKDRKIKFLKSFRPFLKANQPRRELYAIKDGGLHLNLEGTRRLKHFL
ncbi:uncharacterized protein LOC128547791 [Mercenaria mercenaria]|uniref:uncharacterized protein LOC128547791 n=1 Tax=Mercenaria mercenaria TaxID=6596 RepID=UPI00234E97C1|nr:uncharacterized protein LOC128547791 [Mercenaria mercenaria]